MSRNKSKNLKFPGPVLKTSKIKGFFEKFEPKFKNKNTYQITKLNKQVEKCSDFRKERK